MAWLRLGQSGQPNISRSAQLYIFYQVRVGQAPPFFTPRRCGPASFRDGPREFTIQVAESAALVSVRHNHSHCLQPSSPSVRTTYPYPRSAPKVCRCSITLALPFPRSFLTLLLSAHPANRQTWRCRDVTCVFAGAASVATAHRVRPLPHL